MERFGTPSVHDTVSFYLLDFRSGINFPACVAWGVRACVRACSGVAAGERAGDGSREVHRWLVFCFFYYIFEKGAGDFRGEDGRRWVVR